VHWCLRAHNTLCLSTPLFSPGQACPQFASPTIEHSRNSHPHVNLDGLSARWDDVWNTRLHGFVFSTEFYSQQIPFYPSCTRGPLGALDPTAPVTQCNDPCHVTLSHTYTLRGSPTPTLQENSKQGAEGPQRTPSQKQRTITNNVHRK
jgi:hypothetical protein